MKHTKIRWALLVIREMQFKTLVWCDFTPTRMAEIEKADCKKCWWGYEQAGPLVLSWYECKMVQPLWKLTWQKSWMCTYHVLSHSTPGYVPERNESICSYKDLNTSVHSSFICKSHKLGTAPVSISRWMDKQVVEYLHNGILPSYKNEWTIDTHNNVDESLNKYVKWKQPEKKKCTLYYSIDINIWKSAGYVVAERKAMLTLGWDGGRKIWREGSWWITRYFGGWWKYSFPGLW